MSDIYATIAAACSTNDEIATALGGIDKLLEQLGFSLTVPKNHAWLSNALRAGIADGMVKLDSLATALRASSSLPDEPDEGDVERAAEQRALRVVLVAKGIITQNHFITESTAFSFTDDERREIERLKLVWVDGFKFGLRQARGSGGPRHRRVVN